MSTANGKSGNGSNTKGPAFEWWMFSFFAAAAGFGAFIPLLISPYVTEATGDVANAGVVMAVISLAAVLGPVLGGFADKYRAHRLVLGLGVLGMAVLGLMAKSPILIAAAFMQILYQSNPFVRLTQPVVAMRFATVPAGQAQGWMIAALAVGSFLGSMIGGWLASAVGFNAINWMAAIAVGASIALLFFGLWPAERAKRSAEASAAQVG